MRFIKAFILTLLIVLGICGLFLFARSARVREAAGELAQEAEHKVKHDTVKFSAKQLMPAIEKAISSQLQETYGMAQEQADAIVSSVSEEDKNKITEIAANHSDAILETAWYIQAGDTENLRDSLQKELDEQELAELTAIIIKYLPAEYR